ncbi:MAG TPA: hypothetical protein VIM42_11570 [Clostridium sp.]
MSSPNRFAIRDCGEATFYDLTTGKAIVTLKTLKTSGVETSGTTVYSKGGRGNAKLVGFSSDKTAKITFEDAIFDKQALAMLTGNAISTGAVTVQQIDDLAVTSDTVTLSKTPSGAIISVYKINPDGTNGIEYTLGTPTTGLKLFSISAKVITFFAGAEPNGTLFRVYYKMTTDATASRIKISSDKFGASFKIIVEVLVRDEFTKADFAAQIVIPNGKFEETWKMDFKAEGDPSVLSMPIEILKSATSTDMWYMDVFDETLIV